MLLLVFVCYTVGTILAGFATEFYTLLVFRIIQGVAVALVPVAVRIARDLFPPEKFPFAQGVILSMYQGGSAIGLVRWSGCCLFWWLADGLLFSYTNFTHTPILALEVYSQNPNCSS